MSKSKHSEAQIIGALKQVEAGRSVEDLAREQGVSKHTIYARRSKYGGMDVSEAQEVKQLREENTREFFRITDCSISLSRLKSATSFFSWARREESGSAAPDRRVSCE